MKLFFILFLGVLGVMATLQASPLIERNILFGNPEKTAVQISPDAKYISYLAPQNGVLNVFVAPIDKLDQTRCITNDKERGIRNYFWSYSKNILCYFQDRKGDENWQLYSVNLESATEKLLTPEEGVQARIISASDKKPGTLVVGLNNRVPEYHDLYTLDLTTGTKELLLENNEFTGFLLDDHYNLRFAFKENDQGGSDTLMRQGDTWQPYLSVSMEDSATGILDFQDEDKGLIYMLDSRNRDKAALFLLDLNSGKQTLLAEHSLVDVARLTAHPKTKKLQAASFVYLKKELQFFDETFESDYKFVKQSLFEKFPSKTEQDIGIVDRDEHDQTWIVALTGDASPVRYFLFDRKAKTVTFLFVNRSDLEGQPLVPMYATTIQSRDGLTMTAYVSFPESANVTVDPKSYQLSYKGPKLPLILNVHGGPWARDHWGYDPEHQWLANRGYAVLAVNFRSSTGFGKSFLNAGNLEWGKAMQNDLTDAVKWAIDQGIADPAKVVILGGSYGGYATLAGLTMTPELYAAGVDIVGPSNLETLIDSIPAYWKPIMESFYRRVGNPNTDEGKALLKQASPLNHVDNIKKPLLIAQGDHDPRVKLNESEQIVNAMRAKNIPVVYVRYPDEGHGFARPQNRIAFYALTEHFLKDVLGGAAEPLGNALSKSNMVLNGQSNPSSEQAAKAIDAVLKIN